MLVGSNASVAAMKLAASEPNLKSQPVKLSSEEMRLELVEQARREKIEKAAYFASHGRASLPMPKDLVEISKSAWNTISPGEQEAVMRDKSQLYKIGLLVLPTYNHIPAAQTVRHTLTSTEGTDGGDVIERGFPGLVSAGAGNDTVRILSGNAVVIGGAGDDTIHIEGKGTRAHFTSSFTNLNTGLHYENVRGGNLTQVLFGRGDGHDTVTTGAGFRDPNEPGEADLVLRSLSSGEISVSRNGADVTLTITDTQETLTLKDYDPAGFDMIQLKDGTFNLKDFLDAALDGAGSAGSPG